METFGLISKQINQQISIIKNYGYFRCPSFWEYPINMVLFKQNRKNEHWKGFHLTTKIITLTTAWTTGSRGKTTPVARTFSVDQGWRSKAVDNTTTWQGSRAPCSLEQWPTKGHFFLIIIILNLKRNKTFLSYAPTSGSRL